MVEIKTGMKIKLYLTGNRLSSVFTETKLQIDWEKIENGEAQKSEYFLKKKCFQKPLKT